MTLPMCLKWRWCLARRSRTIPRLVRMDRAKEAYQEDEDLCRMLTEYEVQRKAIEQVAGDGDYDPDPCTADSGAD